MASVTGKVRSRKDGSAVPLDDLDRKLLNLMQGQFPLAPRPYAAVAEQAEVTEAEVMARVQRLLADRIMELHPSAMLYRRASLQQVGGWDETLPGGYAEDYDLLLRLARQGAGITGVAHHFAEPYLRSGELEPVLADWSLPAAPAWAVFPGRRLMPARTRAFLDTLEAEFTGPRCQAHTEQTQRTQREHRKSRSKAAAVAAQAVRSS